MIIFIFKRFSIFLLLLCFANYYSQEKKLEELSFREIELKIDSLPYNKKEDFEIINFYIKKAKSENNIEALVYAYNYACKASKSENKGIKYADSAIILSKKNRNLKLLCSAHLNKGIFLMEHFKNIEALNEIIIANQYALQVKDNYIIHKSLYHIAQNKILLGQEKEALIDLYNCEKYFKNGIKKSNLGEDYRIYYIYTIMTIIDCNSKLNKQENSKRLYDDAFSYIKESKQNYFIPYFISCQGTDAYYQKNYNLAITKLKKAIKLYNDVWPHYSEVYYLGRSYWNLGNKEEAIKYFEKLDKEYYADKNQDPQFRPAYELLIEYYKSKNNTDKQLEYINKLIILDQSYEKNYKYLFSKINKEYDTQKLVEEKNEIQNTLKIHQILTILIIISSIITFIVIVYKYKSKKKEYKRTFEKIISEKRHLENLKNIIALKENHPENTKPIDFYDKIPGLNANTLENILNQLDMFEKENQFLDAQISQVSLSEKLGTNASYLSKIIRGYKEKNYNQYINDLRIDYIVNLLQKDSKMLSKDIKELSAIAGFGNSESFSDHFKRKLKMSPTLFIKMMKEEMNNQA